MFWEGATLWEREFRDSFTRPDILKQDLFVHEIPFWIWWECWENLLGQTCPNVSKKQPTGNTIYGEWQMSIKLSKYFAPNLWETHKILWIFFFKIKLISDSLENTVIAYNWLHYLFSKFISLNQTVAIIYWGHFNIHWGTISKCVFACLIVIFLNL